MGKKIALLTLIVTMLASSAGGVAGATGEAQPTGATAESADQAQAAPAPEAPVDASIQDATEAPAGQVDPASEIGTPEAVTLPPAKPSAAASGSAMKVWLYINQKQAFINGEETELTSPATIVNGKMYVPVKFLGDAFGFPVAYDTASNSIAVTAADTSVFIDMTTKQTLVNGLPTPFKPTFEIINDKLMAQLTWMMDQIGATYEYDGNLSRVEVLYVPETPWNPELPSSEFSKPVAKFSFGKSSYKMGEKVKYIDLSYDVEGDGIKFVYWKNNLPAFFTPGEHEVSLQVEDSNGNRSDTVTKKITILNETHLDPVPFQMHHAAVQSFVKLDRGQITKYIASAGKMPVTVEQNDARTLIVSDSPENVTEHGILYRDVVDGKARLYANHLNTIKNADIQIAIAATNEGAEAVTIETTRQGEVHPSIFANLIGYQASVDFLVGETNKPTITVQPGETIYYAVLPRMKPGQGINLMYDIETSGKLTFAFAAMAPNDPVEALPFLKELAYDQHVRGTFPVSDIEWETDAASFTGPKKFTIGDGVDDAFVDGYDVFRQGHFKNYGNYGVVYNIRVKNPGKSSLVMLARGGAFKGAFKINGELVLAPVSGVVTAYDGVFMLARTTGSEAYLDIEYTPPAGSSFPIDLVFYPLD
ncbi:copper amine oxidase N-terminal domain-containing protein [Paenibacillus sp. TRM 82003]|nr:copper amine oxidase N-terminal domain-containing protein [Paenibacillus sp. TRM 82003]